MFLHLNNFLFTGLDPASFLFEWAHLPPSRKLDHTDAHHVEVIHTDGSRIWSDGFGLLGPVGHVDYFPNGGINQPGCKDSVLGALKYQLSKQNLCFIWNNFLALI